MVDTNEQKHEEASKAADLARYWKIIGWYIAQNNLSLHATDDFALLAHVQRKRAEAQGLSIDASWFAIYCHELRSGLAPDAPEFFDVMKPRYEGTVCWKHPSRALQLAIEAAEIFRGPKT